MKLHSLHINFNSTLPANTDVLEGHISLELYPPFVCGESSEIAQGAEGSFGSASPSEEAQLSQHGKRQQSSERSRGRGGRRNESENSLYKGVRMRQGGRWVSEIREPGKKSRIWLGTFPTPEMAARAYDVAAFNLKRPYAYVNFPEAVSSLPIPQSHSPKHIQEAASAAAAAFSGPAGTIHVGRTGGLVPTSEVGETCNLSSTSFPMPEQQQQQLHPQSMTPQTTEPSFLDEDMIFNMPNVLADMAEGLMMTPPWMHHGTDGDNNINNNNGDNNVAESSLWDL